MAVRLGDDEKMIRQMLSSIDFDEGINFSGE